MTKINKWKKDLSNKSDEELFNIYCGSPKHLPKDIRYYAARILETRDFQFDVLLATLVFGASLIYLYINLYENNKERLYTYLESDIDQTTIVFKNYFEFIAVQAAMAKTSYDSIVNARGKSTFAKMYLTKACIDRDVYPVISNEERNKHIFKYLNKDKKKYRGAYTGIKRTGKYNNISKVDFKSMYPSIIVTLNLSPETIEFIEAYELKTTLNDKEFKLDRLIIANNYYPIILHENKKSTC